MSLINNRRFLSLGLLLAMVLLQAGCGPIKQTAEKKEKAEPIIGKTTQEIGEFDPAAGRTLRQDGGDKTNIVNHQFQAMAHVIHETSRLQIKHAMNLFYATEGRYPKSHEEFMEKIIKANNIQLHKPVNTAEYQYDVENHELVVVNKEK